VQFGQRRQDGFRGPVRRRVEFHSLRVDETRPQRPQYRIPLLIKKIAILFHDLLLRPYLCHCVWSVITAHNLTPEKCDNNYSPHPLTPTSLRLVGLVPRSIVSLLLGFNTMLASV